MKFIFDHKKQVYILHEDLVESIMLPVQNGCVPKILYNTKAFPVGCVQPHCKLYVRASVATTTCHSQGPQVNKFEQVSSDDHQMSLAVGPGGPRSDIWGHTVQ